MEERNQRLTTRTKPVLRFWLLTVYRLLFVSVNPLHLRHVRKYGNMAVQHLPSPKLGDTLCNCIDLWF